MSSYFFGTTQKLSFAEQLGKATSSFRKKRDVMMDKLVPVVFEQLKTEALAKAAKQNGNSIKFDLTQFHHPPLDVNEKTELSNRIAQLFDEEELNVMRNIEKVGDETCMWKTITITWPVPEEESDEETETVEPAATDSKK